MQRKRARCSNWTMVGALFVAVVAAGGCVGNGGGGPVGSGDIDEPSPDGCAAADNCGVDTSDSPTDAAGEDDGDDGAGERGLTDEDGDGIPARDDNCPEAENPDQSDVDGDRVGDPCDNCPETPNPDQTDSDGDGTGDDCEAEPSGPICDKQTAEFEPVKPNIYFIIDRSTSMKRKSNGTDRMTRAKDGLDQIAENLSGDVRMGMSTYPCAEPSESCTTVNKEFLAMGDHSKSEIIDSYRSDYDQDLCPRGNALGLSGLDIETGGIHCTETGSALKDVAENNRHTEQGSDLADEREKVVVLVTDGGACGNCNGNGEQDIAVKWAGKLKDEGIAVYTIGFATTNDKLNAVAQAGGTDAGSAGDPRYYEATNASQLASVLSTISKDVISCSYNLDPKPEDGDKVWVKVDGMVVPEDESDGFTYDEDKNVLELHGQACDDLQNASGSTPLEIEKGCAAECETRDDGPGCCKPIGESCQSNAECCRGTCEGGTCTEACYSTGTACRENSDCCSMTCAKSGEMSECVGG